MTDPTTRAVARICLAAPDRLDDAPGVKLVDEPEGVAATDKESLRPLDSRHRVVALVHGVRFQTQGRESGSHLIGIAVPIVSRVGDKKHPVDAGEMIPDEILAVVEVARAVDL